MEKKSKETFAWVFKKNKLLKAVKAKEASLKMLPANAMLCFLHIGAAPFHDIFHIPHMQAAFYETLNSH